MSVRARVVTPLAAVALALAACGAPTPAPAPPPPLEITATPPPAPEPAPGRPLTRGEVALLEPFFRDSVDYAAVRVVDAPFGPFHPAGVMMTPNGIIHAPGALFRSDYTSPTVDLVLTADFFHEVVHVWQHQSGQNLVAQAVATFAEFRGDYQRAYAYALDPACDLLDYNVEQQAAIVTDWFLMARRFNPRDLAAPATRQTYREVLDAFLANPTYARAATPPRTCRSP